MAIGNPHAAEVPTAFLHHHAIAREIRHGQATTTIIVTSISSLMAHNKKGGVMWPVVTNLAPGMALGCFFGAGIAGWLSSGHLQIIVGIFLLWVALQMFRGGKKNRRGA